ncbi:ABC transporter permease [uncultured Desulfuromonas sp.]|uniref:ABC transporter permease n=1 Tax=uncultured Desulfuromonas sp. TaxID=181013 RepID=UPI002AAB6237|nr:ABC transporter permease [uncultured Desulfuromonas sp.]
MTEERTVSTWRLIAANKMAMAGAAMVLAMFVLAIVAPLICKDPGAVDISRQLQSPGFDAWLGTDDLGRDVFSRIAYGARISLLVGFVAVGIATVIGIFLGAVAGYYGGWIDTLVMRFVDIMLCFPSFFLILAVIAFLEPSIWNIMIIIGLTGWMGVARLVRAEFMSLRHRDFVLAIRSLGASDRRIIFRHILPNALSPVLVSAALGVAGAILTESALSFLGIGVQPPTPSWGNMLIAGKQTLGTAWWLSFFPGVAILITVLGYNLLGEGLRDALDPRLKK